MWDCNSKLLCQCKDVICFIFSFYCQFWGLHPVIDDYFTNSLNVVILYLVWWFMMNVTSLSATRVSVSNVHISFFSILYNVKYDWFGGSTTKSNNLLNLFCGAFDAKIFAIPQNIFNSKLLFTFQIEIYFHCWVIFRFCVGWYLLFHGVWLPQQGCDVIHQNCHWHGTWARY